VIPGFQEPRNDAVGFLNTDTPLVVSMLGILLLPSQVDLSMSHVVQIGDRLKRQDYARFVRLDHVSIKFLLALAVALPSSLQSWFFNYSEIRFFSRIIIKISGGRHR